VGRATVLRENKFGMRTDADDRLLVSIRISRAIESLLSELKSAGADIHFSSARHKVIEAWVEPRDLASVANLTGVVSVVPVYAPRTHAGSVHSQGDAVVGADFVRALGFDGSLVKVGVVSDSAFGVTNSQATYDLPALIDHYLEFPWQPSGGLPGSDEGRALMEIVHDLAPGARLAHHSGILSPLSMAEGIRKLAAAGCQIIVDDVGYLDQPFFQDGILAQAVNEVTASNGVLYVSAAGNYGDFSYEANFDGSATNGAWHDFEPGPAVDHFQSISLPAVPEGYLSRVIIVLQWDDPFFTTNGVTHDFDLLLYDAEGAALLASNGNDNIAMQLPSEVLVWTRGAESPTNASLAIRRVAGAGPSALKYVVIQGVDGIDEWHTHSGTIFGQAASASALAIGAVPYYEPNSIEPFSSRGVVTIHFDPDGNRLPAPVIRSKPELVAPDGVNTTFFGHDLTNDVDELPNFTGTSAAAPHVAGIGALVLEANPHLTLSELWGVLKNSVLDLGVPGIDPVFGHGLVQALAAVQLATNVVDVTAPCVRMLSPIALHGWPVEKLKLQLSEPMEGSVATNWNHYSLVGAGPDRNFGSGDDVFYAVTGNITDGARSLILHPVSPTTLLSNGHYRLTLNGVSGLRDPAGNPLNGGTNVTFAFAVDAKSTIVKIDGSEALALRPDGSALFAYPHNPILGYAWPQMRFGFSDVGGGSGGPPRIFPTDIIESVGSASPDLAANETGAVVVWSDTPGADEGTDPYRVGYQILDSSGQPIGGFRVAASPGSFASEGLAPCVVMASDGSFVIAYAAAFEEGSDRYFHVFARRFDPQGTTVGPELQVSETRSSRRPVLGKASNGNLVFAWLNDRAGMFARRFDAAGAAQGPEFRVNTVSVAGTPELAVAADGSFTMAWASDGVWVRRFDAGGNGLGPETRLAQSGAEVQIEQTPDGRALVLWTADLQGGRQVFAQRFQADGTPAGGILVISDGTSGSQHTPRVAMRSTGDFLVAWYNQQQSFARWISWNAPDENPLLGSWIESHMPVRVFASNSPMTSATVQFKRPVVPASFTGADVELRDPLGALIPVSVFVVPASGDRQFLLQFSGQTLRGIYRLSVGPNILDAYGNAMDQNGNGVNGQSSADVYRGVIDLEADVATIPLLESFEEGSVDLLGRYWSFVPGAGTLEISADTSHAGSYALVLNNRSAILHLDLNGQTNVALDFWWYHIGIGSQVADVSVSPDGTNWQQLAEIRDVPQYGHYSFGLDQTNCTSNFQIRFNEFNIHGAHAFWDDIRVQAGGDVFGPAVTNQIPSGVTMAPVDQIIVTFDEPINPLTFTVQDMAVRGPLGLLPLAGAGAVQDSGDQRTFVIHLAEAQNLSGTYTVVIGPNVLDLAGNPMNQNQDALQGDGYTDGSFTIPVIPAGLPFAESFESGNVRALGRHWSLLPGAGGVSVESNNPHSGNGALQLWNQQATLRLNLAGQTNVALDFWLWHQGAAYTAPGLSISSDGTNWTSLTVFGNGFYQHFAFNLDTVGLPYTEDFQIRFAASGAYGFIALWDDIRVQAGVDVFGAAVTNQSPSGVTAAPVSQISVTFNESIDLLTFAAQDAAVTGPLGFVALAASSAVEDSGDQRAFVIHLAEAQNLSGTYTVAIGPNVLDLAGNPMNQNQDTLQGDGYTNTFTIPVLPATLPFAENFESGNIQLIGPHWSFPGNIGEAFVNTNNPHAGSYALELGRRAAVLHLDLRGATNVALGFWLRDNGGQGYYGQLLVSSDGTNWTSLQQLLGDGSYRHFAFNLDAAGVAYTEDFQIRFEVVGPYGYVGSWDDIRVQAGIDVFGAAVMGQVPSGITTAPVSQIAVTFNEPVNLLTFTAQDVEVRGPLGLMPLAGAGAVEDSGDQRTFIIHMAEPQRLSGTYTVAVGPNVLDLAGNPMNQNGDALQGDGYSGSFIIPVNPAGLPFTENFEIGNIQSLGRYWMLDQVDAFSLGLSANTNSPSGSNSLRAALAQSFPSRASAILTLDLSGATNVVLTFLLWNGSSSSHGSAEVWIGYEALGTQAFYRRVTEAPIGIWQSHVIDLDAVMQADGLGYDHGFRIEFRAAGQFVPGQTVWEWDDIRLAGVTRVNRTLRLMRTGSLVELSFVPAPGRTHTIEFKTALEGSWEPLPNAPHNSGFVVDTNPTPQRFYRLSISTP
jgi:hypothetical protein